MSTVSVRGLTRTFAGRQPVAALRSVDLDVADGSLVAVLGPSGCGKTTLLRTLAGMERPDAGSIHLGDRLLAGDGVFVAPERRAIGLVPQEGALFPHLDVRRNISFGLKGLPRAATNARVAELLDLVGLPGHERRRPHQLSGGQQQRVALARALAPRPEVVLLDEPFSALDTGLRSALRDQVLDTLHEAGTTAVLVTHDQVEAMTMADTLAVMHDGVIVQVGTPSEVYLRPVDEWTAGFLGDAVLLPGTRNGSTVTCALGTLPLADDAAHHPGRDVTVFLRPEQLRPALAADEANGRRHGSVSATITRIRFQGPDAMVDLAIADTQIIARWSTIELPAEGQRVDLVVSGPALAFSRTPGAVREFDHGISDRTEDTGVVEEGEALPVVESTVIEPATYPVADR